MKYGITILSKQIIIVLIIKQFVIIVIIFIVVTITKIIHIPQMRMFQNEHPKMTCFRVVETIVSKFIFLV